MQTSMTPNIVTEAAKRPQTQGDWFYELLSVTKKQLGKFSFNLIYRDFAKQL